MGPEVWSGYSAQRPACRDPLPSARPRFLKVTQSHKSKAIAWEPRCRHCGPWGTLHTQTQTVHISSMNVPFVYGASCEVTELLQ